MNAIAIFQFLDRGTLQLYNSMKDAGLGCWSAVVMNAKQQKSDNKVKCYQLSIIYGTSLWCICLVLTLANLHMAHVSPIVVFIIKESYKLFICLLFTATTKYVTVATRITDLTNSQRRIVSI